MTVEPAHNVGWGRGLANLFLGLLLLLAVLALLFGFRAFLYQPFNIPSGTMKPTLLVGDYIVVSKYACGYSRYSLPGSQPLFAGRIFAGEPRYGDVVVFRLPRDPSTDYVKRVVGLPGDRIQMIKGALNLNGTPVKRARIEDFVDPDESGRTTRGKQWRETLRNGASYVTLDLVDEGFDDNTGVYTVPADHYFMMGDNRDNSPDSRTAQVGYVPL
jgi:signal peptidase I